MEDFPRRRGGGRQVLFQRFYRPDDMTRGAFGNSRCSVFNRTRVALHECLDQCCRLMEVLFWLAARFLPKLTNENLVDRLTSPPQYPHHAPSPTPHHRNY